MRILTKRRSGSNSSFIIFPLLITPMSQCMLLLCQPVCFFFASSWDFGFFFVGQSKSRARAFAHSLAGVQRVCMPRSIYMCSCDCVCLTALCCGVPGCYRRLRAYYSSAMHVWMCVCVCDSFEFSLCASISLCTIECLCTVSTHNICKLIGLLCLCSVLLCMCVYVVCIGSIGFFKNVEPAIRDLFVACLSYFASMCVPLNFIWYGVRRAFAIHRRHANRKAARLLLCRCCMARLRPCVVDCCCYSAGIFLNGLSECWLTTAHCANVWRF